MNSKKVTKSLLALVFSLCSFSAFAEETVPQVKIEGYIDTYYSMNNDMTLKKKDQEKSASGESEVGNDEAVESSLNTIGFRKNEFNINTAQFSLSANADWYRAKTTFAYGLIPRQSWSPAGYLPVQEANAGIKIVDNLWLDAGLFLTHVGGEALLPKNNWLSSLALVTMYEPFFQSGVKLSYKPIEQLEACVHVLNGYGIFDDNNADKTLGYLLSYSPASSFNITLDGTVGNELPVGTPAALRVYNNVNATFQPIDSLGFKGQVDFATQAGSANPYLGALLAARYSFTPNLSFSLRGEYINDPAKMLTAGLMGYGGTAGLEFKPTSNSYVRLEGRQLMLGTDDANKMFTDASKVKTGNRLEGMLSMGLSF